MSTAILIDGGFFHQKYRMAFGQQSAEQVAKYLNSYCYRHLNEKVPSDKDNNYKNYHYEQIKDLYRIFYYDCAPLDKIVNHPLKGNVDLSKQATYKWMNDFLDELKKKRKFALRLGELSVNRTGYILSPKAQKSILAGRKKVKNLTDKDFILDVEQKGVDMRIGLDIASLAYKKQVDQIILIAGDSDFVSAAKLARREGIDFVLDALYNNVKPNLLEHIDGLNSCDPAFKTS